MAKYNSRPVNLTLEKFYENIKHSSTNSNPTSNRTAMWKNICYLQFYEWIIIKIYDLESTSIGLIDNG
jgi:hypothetical protein